MVILASKVYVSGDAKNRALDSLRSLILNDLGDLEVDIDLGIRHDDFPTVTIEGEDAVVARNILRSTWGEISASFQNGETYIGTLESWDESGFTLDAGQDVHVPTESLELGPGNPSQIRDRFGLVQHIPLRFVYDSEVEQGRLAPEEQDRLFEWQRGNGRININSATRAQVRATINRAGHAQDIVTIERLGLLEQSVICKEGTDPPGLLASIGEYLPAEMRCVIP